MKHNALGTRFYLTLAQVVIITVVTAIYALAIRKTMDTSEQQLVSHNLYQALDELVLSYRQDPDSPVISTGEMHRYIVDAETLDGLPLRLRSIPRGVSEDIRVDGQRVHAAREDFSDKRLYVTLSIEQLEEREDSLKLLLWGAIIAGYVLALLSGWLVARLLARPIIGLADQVSQLSPSGEPSLQRGPSHVREVDTIAEAIDDFLERLAGFVQRERAFTEDASHELRTPLATLLSAIPLLENDCPPGTLAHKRLQRIKRASEQMQSLVESLLFLAREKGDLIRNQVDLASLVRELVSQREGPAAEIEIRMDLEPVSMELPRGMALTVISNLLNNALEHSGGNAIHITLTPAFLQVADEGKGILPANLEHIFERRYRSTESRGLGLGLYLVKRICDQLAWRIDVESHPQSGTRFTVHF